MKIPRELIAANAAALLVVVVVLFLGWREAAVFGLATLAILNLLVALRGRQARDAAVEEELEDWVDDREGGRRE
jgi:hypothetical protein